MAYDEQDPEMFEEQPELSSDHEDSTFGERLDDADTGAQADETDQTQEHQEQDSDQGFTEKANRKFNEWTSDDE